MNISSGDVVKVTKAYTDGPDVGSDPDLGSVIAEIEYDSLGNRIVKQVKNSAGLDITFHYYYDEYSIVEERNVSDQVIRQYVWSLEYIDVLAEVRLNDDPADVAEDDVESKYYALHNDNFNVLGIVDNVGTLTERYEYTPYGDRTVYITPGSNHTAAHAALRLSQRWQVSSVNQPYGLNPIGHQGLLHDEGSGLVSNRARMLQPRFGRFMQRDPLGYTDVYGSSE